MNSFKQDLYNQDYNNWFICSTKKNCFVKAEQSLLSLLKPAYSCNNKEIADSDYLYYPKIKYYTKRTKNMFKPAFGKYILVKIESRDQYKKAIFTSGVKEFLPSNRTPKPVDIDKINKFKTIEKKNGCLLCSDLRTTIGEEVEIIDGVFKGMMGTIKGFGKYSDTVQICLLAKLFFKYEINVEEKINNLK